MSLTEREELIKCIDDAAAEIHKKHTRFITEYVEGEKQALEFKSRNYEGEVPRYIKDYQEPNGLTPQQACDNMLATGQMLKDLMGSVRDARMKKALIKNAQTIEEARAVAQQVMSVLEHLHSL